MQERPIDVDERELAAVLAERWRLADVELRYAPVGFGGHHWTADTADGVRRFVTLAEGDQDLLRAAMDASAALAKGGLGFVVGPEATVDGESVVGFGKRYGATVFPFLDGVPGRFSDVPPEAERLPMAALLAELHAATGTVNGLPVHEPGLSERVTLDASFDELRLPWTGGPYAEPARELLAKHAPALRDVLTRFDEQADLIRAGAHVITHGEPHQGNVLHVGGRRMLIDWDTVRLAPRERDLWIGVGDDRVALDHYAELTGYAADADVMAFYRLRWALDDIAIYLGEFRSAHEKNADTKMAWDGYAEWLVSVAGG